MHWIQLHFPQDKHAVLSSHCCLVWCWFSCPGLSIQAQKLFRFFWHAADFLFFSAPILTLSRRTSVTTVTVGTRFSNNNAQEYPATMKGFFESYLCIGNFISPFHWSGSQFCQDGRPEGNGDRYASLRKSVFWGHMTTGSVWSRTSLTDFQTCIHFRASLTLSLMALPSYLY